MPILREGDGNTYVNVVIVCVVEFGDVAVDHCQWYFSFCHHFNHILRSQGVFSYRLNLYAAAENRC